MSLGYYSFGCLKVIKTRPVVDVMERYPLALTISFDDGNIDQFTNAFLLMRQRGMVGTYYIITGIIGQSDKMDAGMLLNLRRAGNEIASHSHTHRDFKDLSGEEIREECRLSKQVLKTLGLEADNFRYPYADSTPEIDKIVSEYFRSGCYGRSYMKLPIMGWRIYTMGAWGENLETLKNFVDYATENGLWMNINFHHIRDGYGTGNGNIEIVDFEELLDYILGKGFITLTVREALNVGKEDSYL